MPTVYRPWAWIIICYCLKVYLLARASTFYRADHHITHINRSVITLDKNWAGLTDIFIQAACGCMWQYGVVVDYSAVEDNG